MSAGSLGAWRTRWPCGVLRGIGLDEKTPDHSTISRTRRLIDLETHREVFGWALGLLADRGLLKGKRIAIDATTLEANAAMRSIVRRDTGENYEEFLLGLAKASGMQTPTREDLARLDRKRKKRMSNQEWKSPADEDARITKMKDGRTRLAHKAEHGVDLDTGAVVAVTLQGADQGDTATLNETLSEAGMAVAELVGREAEQRPHDKPQVNVHGIEELVGDKGYHSGAVVLRVKRYEVRTYISGAETATPKRSPQLAGQSGGTKGGVPESATGAGRVRQELTAPPGGVGGTQLCALLRHRRHAAHPSAWPREYSETAVDPRRCLQPKSDPAATVGSWHTTGVEKPRGSAYFVRLLVLLIHREDRASSLREPKFKLLCALLCQQPGPNTPIAVPETSYLHHRLLGSFDSGWAACGGPTSAQDTGDEKVVASRSTQQQLRMIS